jgi:hypothetical protein
MHNLFSFIVYFYHLKFIRVQQETYISFHFFAFANANKYRAWNWDEARAGVEAARGRVVQGVAEASYNYLEVQTSCTRLIP